MTRAPPATPVLLELQLLGVPQVRLGDVVKLATRKALAALAYLALNGPSPRATLASLLWTRHSSDDARRNLRQELHRILATPAGPWLDTDGDLLRLVPGFVCDALQVRAAVAAGDLDTAVALYRGELLAGFELGGADAFSEWLQQQRASLAETWRGAARRVITAREAAGDLDAALQVAQMLVDHNPLDEPSVRDAIRLRHGRGDRAGALGQFDRLRNLLHDELGVAPEAETIALVKRVELTAPSPAAPTDASLPSLHPPLVGRDSAWQQLAAAASTVAVIEGDAGVGKTRLAQEFARAHGGVLLLKGREISRDTPLYPVAEALLTAYREDTAWFERLDPAWRAEVARLLPTLAGDEPSADLPYAEGRSRFLDGLANALLTAAAGGTLLFDDLQWFDASSAELLAHLARRSHRVRLLATARSEELPSNTAVQSALEALAREALLVRLPLTPLTEDEVLHLVRALSGSSGATVFSRRLHKATAGNALFILESLRDLFGAGVLWRDQNTWATRYDEETEDYRELPISTSVRDAVLRRIDRLGEPVRRLLETACLAGDGFDAERVAPCAGLSEWDAVRAVELALRANLLQPAVTGYRFSHDLVRRSIDDALSPERRRLLHRQLAQALVAAQAEPAQIANHLERGGRASEAVPYRIGAAEAAARVYSHRDALAEYALALADGPPVRTAFAIHSARADLLRNLDDSLNWAQALTDMQTLAATLADPALSVELAVKQAVHHFDSGRHADALWVATDARARLHGQLDPVTEGYLLLEMGAAQKALGQLDDAEALLREALGRFEGRVALKHGNAAFWLCLCAIDRGDLDRAAHWSQVAVEASAAAGYRRGHAMSLWTQSEVALLRGDQGSAIEILERALAEAREIGSVSLQVELLNTLVARLEAAGRADLAAAQRERIAQLQAAHGR